MAALTFKTMSFSMPAYSNDLIQTAVLVHPLLLLNVPTSRGLFRSRLRILETHYHPTLDPAVLWTPLNDSLNMMPPALLYIRTLWRYTNAVIINIVIIIRWPVFSIFLFCSFLLSVLDGIWRAHRASCLVFNLGLSFYIAEL